MILKIEPCLNPNAISAAARTVHQTECKFPITTDKELVAELIAKCASKSQCRVVPGGRTDKRPYGKIDSVYVYACVKMNATFVTFATIPQYCTYSS